jgi:RimJ/RimL family protein N-acetyltransferase
MRCHDQQKAVNLSIMLTPDVRLRPLEPLDATVMAAWALDERFCLAANWSFGNPLAAYVTFHEGIIREPPAGLVRLGVAGDGELVGYIDLHGSKPHRRELGSVIGDSRRWGRGLGSAAARRD